MTERRCGTCRWWTQSRRTAPIIWTCGAVLPSWASRALSTMMPVTFDDDGADCLTWAPVRVRIDYDKLNGGPSPLLD